MGTASSNQEVAFSPANESYVLGDIPVIIVSDDGSSGTTTPPVIIDTIAPGKEDSAAFISDLNRRLTEEHRQILQKIESDLDSKTQDKAATKDSHTDSDAESFTSDPVTKSEIEHAKEKQTVLSEAEDVKKSLEAQCDEISALRAQMLGEYEQLLTVRAEVMSSQSEEVEKLQQEMALIQQQYEEQMKVFQEKVQEQTETALSASHTKELDEMKQYYENRVSEMEKSYTTDINKLKAEHAELLSRLHEESTSPVTKSPTSSPDKQREYVRKTTTLTVISDEEDEMDGESGSPSKLTEKLNARIKALEDKLKEREKVVDSLKKRLEAEATSAEDLHGRLLDNSKTLIDCEESMKLKLTEIEELKAALSSRDDRISQLENEKAALEERGEKEIPKGISDNEIIEQLKERIKSLESELSASKETNARIQDELNKLDAQHGEAIMQLKDAMEKLNQTRIDELQQSFQIQLEEELKQQAEDLEAKFRDESGNLEKELEIYKKSESELKDKLAEVQSTHEKQLSELQEKLSAKDLTVDSASSTSQSETKVISFSDTSELDRDTLDFDSVSVITESKEKQVSKIEYEGFVAGIRKDYEEKIKALQSEIAQYRSSNAITVSSTPMSPVSPKSKETFTLEKASGDAQGVPSVKPVPDAGSEIPVKPRSNEEQEIYEELSKEFETSFKNLRSDYENQIENLSKEISALKENSDQANRQELEKEIRAEIENEYKEKIDELTKALEASKAEKTAAEQKVKADMFVWHEEVVSQLKRKHEQTISQLHKEYEEKMDLLREEMQEEFDAEKAKLLQEHKREIADMEDRYDNLVEGLRTGEVPEVAQIVQDKYDMELEMAKTLIQQECDETIESEQSRLSEEYEKNIKQILNEKEKELEEQKNYYEKQLADQKAYYEKELVDQRNSLLQQYEAQVIELKSRHEAALKDAKEEFEQRVDKIRAESLEMQVKRQETLVAQKSVSEESEKDEETEKVTTTTGDSGSDKSDKDDHDDDEPGASKGGALSGPSSEPLQKDHEDMGARGESSQEKESDKGEEDVKEVQEEMIIRQTKVSSLESSVKSFDASDEESDLVRQLRNELEEKIQHYESLISELKAVQEEEIKQLTAELEEKEEEYTKRLKDLEERHELEMKEYTDEIQKLKEGEADADNAEALEMAHQEEMKTLENRLVLKHRNEMENLEKQHQSKLDDMAEKHKTVIEDLQKQLTEAQRALDQYPDIQSPIQIVPTFHGDSTLGSTKESVEDFMVPTKSSGSLESAVQAETPRSEQGSDMGTMETQVFEARTTSEDVTPPGSPDRTFEEDVGVKSLETSMDRSRGSLRGVDDTQDTDMIEFSEEDSDKSIDEAAGTGKSGRSTPVALLQTLPLGSDIPVGPTVKSLDDTTDSSFRVSDREDLTARIKELESEVEDLRSKLDYELTRQDDQHDRLDREHQEKVNLVAMLRADIDRLNGDRETYQSTNEHLLGLLSDAVKTFMGVEENINKRLKTLMEKPAAEKPVDKPRPGSDERRKTPPPPQKLSPVPSPGRISPARAEDPENPQETSILSNITDEGLDLSQRICDSIFQGPELAAEEEELLTDSGHRLQTSVGRLLDMIEDSTSQLLETKQTQSELMDQLDGKGTSLEQMTARCNDLEERLKEEVERKDFLALELHKAEGLIEGFTSEREIQDQKVQELEEQKETLVLELETTKNKLQDLADTHSEAQQLKKQLEDQEQLLKRNVGEEAQVLMLEVSRLSSENREKDSKIQQVHEKFESRVRELENSGEDMEHHYSKLLDERKQELADMKLQVDALEKQLKSKKQFIEEQSVEREQEHEDYQRDLTKWKQAVHDLEKQHGSESRLHKEVEELSEQLQTRIDLHNEALLESEKLQRTVREKETQVQDLKGVIQSTEQELQEKTDEIEQMKQKLAKLEEELSKRPFPDDDLTDSVKSDGSLPKPTDSSDLEETVEHYRERLLTQMSVEEELRQAANRTKEELVREKHALQTQVNENLVKISALRNKLDEMRHRKDLSDPSDLSKRLDVEREKSELKDKQISDMKLEMEKMMEKIESKEHEVEQLIEKDKAKRTSPVEGLEYESDKEIERQMENLKRQNRNLKDKLRLAEAGTVTDMSGLSQSLIDEKNQEIDQLSEQVFRLQTEFNELKADKGVEGVTSIQQEMEEFEADRQEKMANLETEVTTLKAALDDKESHITSLQTKVDELTEQVKQQDSDDDAMLQEILHEKEEMVTQLTVQIEGLQSEVDNLTEFQTKLQEDFDTVQTMLDEKEKEIDTLTKELESSSVDRDQHALVIKHEVEIARLKKDLREKDNVVEEKMEEIAEMVDKIELLDSQIVKYKTQEAEYDNQIVVKDREILRLKKELDIPETSVRSSVLSGSLSLSGRPIASLSEEEKVQLIEEQTNEIKTLKANVEELLGRPPSPPLSEEDTARLIRKQKDEIEVLRQQIEAITEGQSPASTVSEEIKSDVIQRLKREIERLKQQIMDSNLSEDDKSALIRHLRLENETLKRQVDAALKIKPPSPPLDEDEKSEKIHKQKEEISSLKNQLEASLTIRPPSPPRSDDEKSVLIEEQKEEIVQLRKQVQAALQAAPVLSPPQHGDEKDKTIELKQAEVAELRTELSKVTQAVNDGKEGELVKGKIEEVITLKTELSLVKQKLESQSQSSVESMQETIKEKENKLLEAEEKVKQLEEDLESAKEVKAYEDEIQLQEKDDEIEELKSELEGLRSRAESSTIAQSVDIELPSSDEGSPESKELERSMSFYKDQYEEKCSESRKLQVELDLVKYQLEKARSDKLEDAEEEIELFKAELERKSEKQVEEIKEKKESLDKENTKLRQQLSLTTDERIVALEKEVEEAKAELAKERLDSIQAINDVEKIRERKEKERRSSIKTIQELEHDLDEKMETEKELRTQVKTLNEEITVIKKQYGIEDQPKDSSRPRSKLSSFRSESTDSFELGTDVDTLQEQVMQYKKQAEKSKEVLAEKQKYQSQVVKLEIQYENLQKQMKKEVSQLEDQLKSAKTSSEQDVWAQLQATQDKLEKTTEQLAETGQRLSNAESRLNNVSKELMTRESDMKALQQDLWKTSGQLSVTSGKLQETEEKLRLTVGQVTEREDQIHQLQRELQHTQQEVERAEIKSRNASDQTEEVKYLEERLKKTEKELEEVQKSLKESVQMSEQQLQMVELKDEEYVKLKLDIQQTIASKEKIIKDQKKALKDTEDEKNTVKEKMTQMEKTKDKEILQLRDHSSKLQEESSKLQHQVETLSEELNRPGREAERESPTLVTLRAQLQNQEEVILTLGSDLQEAKVTITDREKEIEEIQARNVQMRRDEADTVEAMHNQIADLQRELEELRSVTKNQGHQGERSQDRDESPFDQNGRTPSQGRTVPGQRQSPEHMDVTDTQTYRQIHDSPSFDDSGHQSYDHPTHHESQARPGGQSPRSPQQEIRRSPPSDHPDDGDDDHPQGQGQRVFSMQSSRLGQQIRVSHEVEVSTEPGQTGRHSQTGSPTSQKGSNGSQTGQRDLTGSPTSQRDQTGSPTSQRDLTGSPSNQRGQTGSFASQRGVPDEELVQEFRSQLQESPRHRPHEGVQLEAPQLGARDTYQDTGRGSQGESRSEHLRSQPSTEGEIFDRDGNLRPRYSRSVEGHTSVDSGRSQTFQQRSPGESGLDSQRVPSERGHSRSGQSDYQGEGQRETGEGSVPEGLSPDTERYIQQMRRELLITKTALMQIQRGERLDREMTPEERELVQDVLSDVQRPNQGLSSRQQQPVSSRADRQYTSLPDDQDVIRLRREIEKLEEELELYRSSSNLSARDFVQKVMSLKDELSNEHQRHVEELTTRSQQDTESQLAAMRIKFNDEIDHLKANHVRGLDNKLQDLRQNLERKHKKDTNKLIVKHQEEVSLLKARGSDAGSVGRQDGVGQERSTVVNGHREPMSGRVQGILHRLHTEGVQVLTISELETLQRSQTQSEVPRSTDIESLQAGWENERQSYLSTIQSLKDLLSQTHKLQGLEKDDVDDDNDDYFMGAEQSDWRAELLRAIAYVFTKERESLLAELRSHVLSHPNSSFDEIQRLEHKIRTMESHHHDSMDQIFNADRQSMLAEIRDLHAHATIARMHNHEERAKANEKLQDSEDQAMKKERQLKRQVQLLEFKIQQEKILQDDLRTSLDAERTRSTELSTQLNEEKTGTFDLQNTVSALQMQIGKLKENLEREQSRYVSVTNALEEEKSKSLNLSELLESERQTLWRVQSELESVRQQQTDVDIALVEQLQTELAEERERRAQAESRMEIDHVSAENLRQEVEMEKRRQVAIETEMSAKISNLQKLVEMEKQRNSELDMALERERNLSHHLRQQLDTEKSNSEELTGRERALIEDLNIQLDNQRIECEDLKRALQQEQRTRENMTSAVESEKRLLKDHLDQERSMNNDLKREMDQLQFDRLEAVNKVQKEREAVQRLKMEQDKVNEELRKLRNLELQRDQDRAEERQSERDKCRSVDREKEEYRMKLHEQELETQRLTQKLARMEEQLADSREKELRAIRDLEHERMRIPTPTPEMISVQTSPRLDTHEMTSSVESMAEQRERWHVYKSQLESMCQSLHYLILRSRDQLGKAAHGGSRHTDVVDFEVLQTSLRDLLSEVKQLQEMEGDFMSHPSSTVNERILRQNEELTGFVARMSEEKTELRNALTQLEEEIWRYRQMDSQYQDMQRTSEHADHMIVAERAEWAKEKLSLQMALNSAEREIDLLQTDLRVERERRVQAGITDTQESDKIKIQRLYGKYLRAESFRKGLVYQKKYLLVLLGGFQDTEETTLALLSRMGAVDHRSLRRIKPKPLTAFRGAVRVVIAISRMRYLVKKWRRATRVGSEVVGGVVDQTNGYVPQSNSYSPPRHGTSPRYSSAPVRSSSSPPHSSSSSYRRHSPLRSSDPPPSSYGSQSSHFEVDPYSAYAYQPRLGTSRMPTTPPKKDYSSTTKYTSPSSGARRKILTSASIPAPSNRVRFTSDASNNGTLGDPDEYINRLENLQTRLGSLQSGRQRTVRQPWR